MTAEFTPGERLVESVLCEKFAVSRTVVREVLRQLEAEGLVTIVPNRGPEVATLTIREAESLYEVRRALESLAGSLFAERATDEQCTELVHCLNEVKKAMASDDPGRKLEVKDRYYDVLLAGAGNEEIRKLLRVVNARTQVLRMYSLSSENRGAKTVAEITRITAAAAINRDPDEVRIACEEHVRNAADAALLAMKRASGH
ncbi:GntR family transcriptional regulator [Pseudarthrobacter sp. NS4]|uniref:GntR family transcriptional regulator n=1 Tax=Pseudarthrobacter sp. NS4 TaxID=2973976 RepID=UPI002161E767|nr:GntR family transcriptional regulator [Pseudarthrobacter sp. NS4]